MLRLIVAALGAAALLLALASAHAAGPERGVLPKPDPPGKWRLITKGEDSTTSTCIGSTATPLCAVETTEACKVRPVAALCDIGMIPKLAEKKAYFLDYQYDYIKYRVVSARWARQDAEPFPDSSMRYGPYIKKGDALLVIHRIQCRERSGGCWPIEQPPWTYIVRKMDRGWQVVIWDYPTW